MLRGPPIRKNSRIDGVASQCLLTDHSIMSEQAAPVPKQGDLILALDPDRIVSTIAKLEKRIEERFPDSGLGQVCGRLRATGEQTVGRLDRAPPPWT